MFTLSLLLRFGNLFLVVSCFSKKSSPIHCYIQFAGYFDYLLYILVFFFVLHLLLHLTIDINGVHQVLMRLMSPTVDEFFFVQFHCVLFGLNFFLNQKMVHSKPTVRHSNQLSEIICCILSHLKQPSPTPLYPNCLQLSCQLPLWLCMLFLFL